MLHFLPPLLIGIIASLLFGVNVLIWPMLVLVVAVFKIILPLPFLRRLFDPPLRWFSENWISCNDLWMRLTQKTQWDVQGLTGLDYRGWYLVSSNHQSWVDIFVMQHLLNRRIPLLKFFIKRELIWVPVMGLAWWALDFPFLRRHSAKFLQKHPRQKGKDLETTRLACKKFAHMPTSVMNFLEGTRFSPKKHARQQSPYRHLLRPKAGGIALALNVLGDKFHSLLDITIVYPDGIPTFWEFLCGKVNKVIVRVKQVEIPQQFLGGDYDGDQDFRAAFQQWVHELWQEKDLQIQALVH
ncbi:MAG: putative acyltransferase YihG [Smithella sp. PtaU1.Bin162]|nr:MAG: putative acyltransferase YihG [Smithella sp. PtaU1.Bin162]